MTIHERVASMFEDVNNLRTNYRAKEIQRDTVSDTVTGYETDLTRLREDEINYGKAVEVFKTISDDRSEGAKRTLEEVLNWALSNIKLEQRYEARLDERDSGRSGKELVITLRDLDTGYERTLRNQSGTAVAQIVSFLVNIIVIKLSGSSRIMVMDEVFSGLQDKETILMFGDIMVALARNEGFQFIIVEHKSLLAQVEGIETINLKIDTYEEGLVLAS